MITVRDVWRGTLPPGTELIAGGAGLERRVEWATALRTRAPAFDQIKGGELAFVPVKSIKLLDDRLDLAQVMSSLSEKGGVAVAISGDASSDAIAVADRLMLPLLRLPTGTVIADVQHSTTRFILDQRSRLHEKEHELRVELTELALSGAGPAAIVDRLAAICACPATWRDEDGTVRHQAGGDAADEGDLAPVRRWLAGMQVTAADPPVSDIESDGTSRLVAPIPLRDGIGGYISVAGVTGPAAQLARIGVARAASACAIDLDRERAVTAARDDIEGGVVAALVSGAFASEEAIAERARRVGLDASRGNCVIVIAVAEATLEAAVASAHRWASTHLEGALTGSHNGRVCVIVGGADEQLSAAFTVAAQHLCNAVAAGVAQRSVSAGIGRVAPGAAGIRLSHDEAVQAEAMGKRLYGQGRAVAFAELGLHRLLFAMARGDDLRSFHDDVLGPLRAHDKRGHAALLPTLEAFFACNGSPTDMAAELHLHRNTVLYRLRRIQEIAGIDLDDPLTRLRLHLCLRAADVLEAAH